jgi:hypothetical protein
VWGEEVEKRSSEQNKTNSCSREKQRHTMAAFGQQIGPRLPLLLRSISHHPVMLDRH